jgi:hypothetical protein
MGSQAEGDDIEWRQKEKKQTKNKNQAAPLTSLDTSSPSAWVNPRRAHKHNAILTSSVPGAGPATTARGERPVLPDHACSQVVGRLPVGKNRCRDQPTPRATASFFSWTCTKTKHTTYMIARKGQGCLPSIAPTHHQKKKGRCCVKVPWYGTKHLPGYHQPKQMNGPARATLPSLTFGSGYAWRFVLLTFLGVVASAVAASDHDFALLGLVPGASHDAVRKVGRLQHVVR